MILLDTHVLVWFREGSRALGRKARRIIEREGQLDQLRFSAISFYEIGLHVANARLKLDEPPGSWHEHAVHEGIRELVVTSAIAVRASELGGMPGDPFDRIISATAIVYGIPLVTADAAMLDWRGDMRRIDARA